MIRVNASKSGAGAVANYYFQYLDTESLGSPRWTGKGAVELGLNGKDFSGIPTKEVFLALASNLNPNTGAPLTARHVRHRRLGYEFVVDGPKSGSICALVLGDHAVTAAFRTCNGQVMEQIEADMKCRVRVNGAMHDRVVGNLCGMEVIHATARPVAGSRPPAGWSSDRSIRPCPDWKSTVGHTA